MKVLIILCIVLTSISCQNKQKDITNQVMSWKGKEIIFPEHIPFSIDGKDTINLNWFQSSYKIVTYLDSTGCSGCRLQLPHWNQFIRQASMLNKNVRFFFYLHPRSINSVKHLIKRNHFIYPVCFDPKDEFCSLNRLSSDTDFHTFLLDKHNRVIAIGNPINSAKIEELYMDILANKFEE